MQIKYNVTGDRRKAMVAVMRDILQETTHLLFAGKPVSLLRRAFGEENEENTFVLPGTMSRKKQVVPLLIEAARMEEQQ